MTAMNETSTITLPEYHNLLALLLLNLNTPSVSSSSTTQEEEMIKKREEETMLTQNQVQDSRTEQVIKHHTWRKRQTSHTRHAIKKRETSVTPKKEKQTKPVYHQRARKHKPHTREKNHTPKRQKEKRKTTRHIPASPASITPRLQPTQTRIQSSVNFSIIPYPASTSLAVTHPYTLSAYRPHAY